MRTTKKVLLAIIAAAGLFAANAHASLTAFQTYSGAVGVSTDGWGSTTQKGTISALVPVGSTVVAAYLYTSTYSNPTLAGVGGTLAGTNVNYTSVGVNAASCCSLTAGRMDVTSIIKPLVDGGVGGVYNFSITETSVYQDGSALVVVYSNPALSVSTIGILDGFASVTGDTTSINFASALHPANAGFKATMSLGIGFSCCNQKSTVKVNGTTISTESGNNDDSADAALSNGNLITVGGFDDAFTPANPTYGQDHERYDLTPYIVDGQTSIKVDTINASQDDNIFLAVFDVSGLAGVNELPPTGNVPEPETLALFGLALAGLGLQRRRTKSV